MARAQVAGALVLDRLRERIVSGLFLGRWRPGDRLPSIREIAGAEGVDRKTAAAAYRRLEEDGLVQIRPRSGIYLRGPQPVRQPGGLERLQRTWLEHTYEGAHALGLGTQRMLDLLRALAEVEREAVPVVECTAAHAEALAAELRERASLNAVPVVLTEAAPDDPLLTEAELVITTPYHLPDVCLMVPSASVVDVTLAPESLRRIEAAMQDSCVVLAAGSTELARKLERALRSCGLDSNQLRVIATDDRAGFIDAARDARTLVVWPGAAQWLNDRRLFRGVQRVRLKSTVAEDALARIRTVMLDRAMRRVKSRESEQAAAVS
jgi:DNA-binding transcriptional regulator YhcF (GntR family)